MAEKKAVKPIPEGWTEVTPYLIVRDGSRAIAFYKKAFGARELYRIPMPDGRVGHAEMQIGGARFMLADEAPEMGAKAPPRIGGTPVSLLLYTTDVDACFAKAVELGAKVIAPVENKFYGDRAGVLEDPFGHKWAVATHVEDVSPEDMARRMKEMPPPQ